MVRINFGANVSRSHGMTWDGREVNGPLSSASE